MSNLRIDNVSAGIVFVYDVDTGDVLWTHEEIMEVTDNQEHCQKQISQSDCEAIRTTTAQIYPNRKLDFLIAPEDFTLRENTRVTVDPYNKTLLQQTDEKQSFAERFAEFRTE